MFYKEFLLEHYEGLFGGSGWKAMSSPDALHRISGRASISHGSVPRDHSDDKVQPLVLQNATSPSVVCPPDPVANSCVKQWSQVIHISDTWGRSGAFCLQIQWQRDS